MRKNFGAKPFLYPQPVMILGTYDENGNANAMNAAWGGIVGANEIIVDLSAHKTTDNIIKNKAFTVGVADLEHLVACDYVGIVSANKEADKMKKAGFTTTKSEFVNAPIINELPLTLECELVKVIDEKFILEYYSKHFPELSVSASQIPWSVDDGIRTMLPVMQSDIHLQKGNTVLIIDAKYYSHTTQTQYDKHTLHSNNMYQIFTYVKNRDYEFGDEDHKVSGMLLYAKTEEEIQPDNVYQMHGNQITVRTLDLNLPFSDIAKQLNTIAETHFDLPERSKV